MLRHDPRSAVILRPMTKFPSARVVDDRASERKPSFRGGCLTHRGGGEQSFLSLVGVVRWINGEATRLLPLLKLEFHG